MKPPPVHRKWTSAAAIAGLLVSAAGSAPAWAQRDTDEINDEIEQTDEDLTAAVEAYNQLAQEAQDNRDMVAQTQEDLEAAEADLNSLRTQLADYLTATYVDQGIGDTALLLDSGSPDAFVERLDRLNSANLYNFALLDELKTASEEYTVQLDLLADLQTDLDEQEAELDQQQEELNARMADLEEEWQAAAGDAITDYDLPYMNDDEYAVVSFALDQVGKQYVWGTAGPDTYDCSGLILRAYAQIGIDLPHNAAAQYNSTANISREELQPGDLVFYNDLSHMGMYIGNGLIVHAPNSRTVVKVVELDHGNVWYGATTILH
ncbi:C40 family peptidase [Glycomyces dulcitolivorans]|uniref:C40 family peptidase n=1 Tax=Glycomyces dulcitolivorans TaxID=2200759 RepID=UPI000DD4934C|nr:C40 family peptidase [Glycomyces dulcitolivorans]